MNIRNNQKVPRRSVLAGVGVTSAVLASRQLFASPDGIVPTMLRQAAGARIQSRSLRRRISVLDGSGGNIAVLTGHDGELLVDAGFSVSRTRISEALASLGGGPIKHLINTHWHFDHTNGNEWLHGAGAMITAHENARKWMSVSTRVEAWRYTFPPMPSSGLPTQVFDTACTIKFNDTTINMSYYGPAHTDSDISVHFMEADVLHVGDTWWNGFYPFIDYSTGGNIDGMISATERNLALASGTTLIIPGHGPVGMKSHLAKYRDMLIAVRERISTLKKQGRSLEESIAAKPTAAFDDGWGKFLMTPDVFAGLVYAGV